jgi:energy-converting hydrogenase Eha subunit H
MRKSPKTKVQKVLTHRSVHNMDMRISIIGSADIRIVCSVEKAKIGDVSFEYVAIVAPSHRDFTPDAPL